MTWLPPLPPPSLLKKLGGGGGEIGLTLMVSWEVSINNGSEYDISFQYQIGKYIKYISLILPKKKLKLCQTLRAIQVLKNWRTKLEKEKQNVHIFLHSYLPLLSKKYWSSCWINIKKFLLLVSQYFFLFLNLDMFLFGPYTHYRWWIKFPQYNLSRQTQKDYFG